MRLPEDVAQHLQVALPQAQKISCDFLIRDGQGPWKRLEAKSLWGTDTSKARLIHNKTKGWVTSSCRFSDQDFFAVNMWLRTGCITDIMFARSVLRDATHPHGLPPARSRRNGSLIPAHVTQNPPIPDPGVWFPRLRDVWNLP